MHSDLTLLQSIPLFNGIKKEELRGMLGCLNARKQRYEAGEVILLAGERAGNVGVLLSGRAQVVREDYAGNRTILTQLSPGELFAEVFACASGSAKTLPISVLSIVESEALLLDYRRIISSCTSACAFHTRLIENMLAVLANKSLLLNRRLGHLSKRSTREKLLSYLEEQAAFHNSRSFAIEFNRQELADYLCVERSAMSAALGKLQAEGLVRYHKNQFWLPGAEDALS